MNPKDVYQTVKDLSLPFIKSNEKDLLFHDKNLIEGNINNNPFLHFTGTLGTHMFMFPSDDEFPKEGERVKYLFGTATRYHMLDDIVKCVKWCRTSNRQALILYYDGTRISKINQDIAESLAEDFVSTTKRRWNK